MVGSQEEYDALMEAKSTEEVETTQKNQQLLNNMSEEKKQGLNIELTEEVAEGTYSN